MLKKDKSNPSTSRLRGTKKDEKQKCRFVALQRINIKGKRKPNRKIKHYE